MATDRHPDGQRMSGRSAGVAIGVASSAPAPSTSSDAPSAVTAAPSSQPITRRRAAIPPAASHPPRPAVPASLRGTPLPRAQTAVGMVDRWWSRDTRRRCTLTWIGRFSTSELLIVVRWNHQLERTAFSDRAADAGVALEIAHGGADHVEADATAGDLGDGLGRREAGLEEQLEGSVVG